MTVNYSIFMWYCRQYNLPHCPLYSWITVVHKPLKNLILAFRRSKHFLNFYVIDLHRNPELNLSPRLLDDTIHQGHLT